jgi:serine/threonine protein kinase/tetratricopeptide (TPR) repeat protein
VSSLPPALEPARWAELGPRLDELLALDPAARAVRLAAWRVSEPLLADQLQDLLDTYPAIQSDRFLEDDVRASVGLVEARSQPVPEVVAGTVCGAWTLERPLGSGGMGSVWLARRTDGRYQAAAAIKLPHRAVLAHGGAARFEREGRMLARVSHPHIAALLDAGVAASGQPYLVLEYVQGEPIDCHCDRLGLDVRARIGLFLDVLGAVAHAHAQLVLHRDLKPSNILVDAAGQVKLLDFGIAKLIEGDDAPAPQVQTQRLFTPEYAAPEQLQGEPVGTATDVYALGVLLYRLLVTRHPTATLAQTPMERLRGVVETLPVPMSELAARLDGEACAQRATHARQLARTLRGDLDTIVGKALKKSPGERYAGAAAFGDDLRRWCDGLPVLAQPDSAGYRLRLFVRRHRVALGVAALVLGLLVGAGSVAGWQAVEARRERDEARWQADRARARNELLSLMLGQLGSLDAPLTQRQILDRAVQLVQSRFGAQPRVAVELLLPIAGQYHSQGDVQADLKVMELASRLAQDSGQADLIATTACSTIDTYVLLDRVADAEGALATAARALAQMRDPPAMTQATCGMYEAQVARDRGQYRRALDAALRARQRLEAAGLSDSNVYTALLGLLVFLHRDNGDMSTAFATADQLAETFRRQSLGSTLDALYVDRTRALLMADAGELSAAVALIDQVVAKAGGADGDAASVLLPTQAQLVLSLGHVERAEALLAKAARRVDPVGNDWSDTRLAFARAVAASQAGRAAEALRWLDSAQRSPRAGLLRFVIPTPGALRARLLLAERQVAAAQQAIDVELAELERAGVGNLEQRAEAWRTAGEIQLAAGQPARAASHAERALEASTRAARDPNGSARVGESRWLLARALLAQGDAAAAQAQAARAADALTRGAGAGHALSLAARAFANPR